jgi:DNA-binding Lrp family transcriptional regulator
MTTAELYRDLCSLGFSEKEAELLIALSRCSRATPGALSNRTKISRPTIYNLLASLEKLGVVHRHVASGKTSYSFSPQSGLVRLHERRAEEAIVRVAESKRVARGLEENMRRAQVLSPSVEFCEGAQGIDGFLHRNAHLWHDAIASSDGIWWGYEDEALFKNYRSWFQCVWTEFSSIRKDKIEVRVFTEMSIPHDLATRYPNTHFRMFHGDSPPQSTLWLMGNYVVLFVTESDPRYAYQICDGALAQVLRQLFRKLWLV